MQNRAMKPNHIEIKDYLDLKYPKEDIENGVFNLISSQYSNLLGLISSMLSLTGIEAIELLEIIGSKFKKERVGVYGMSFSLDDIQGDSMFAKGGQIISVAYRHLMSKSMRQEKELLEREEQLRKRKPELKDISSFSKSTFTPTKDNKSAHSSLISTSIAKDDEADLDVIELAKRHLKTYTKEEMAKNFGGAIDNYVEIESQEDLVLVKHHSVSCGLHDRFHATKVLAKNYFATPKKIAAMYLHIYKSLTPYTSDYFDPSLLYDINKLIEEQRTKKEEAALKKAGVDLGHATKGKYVASTNVSYYRAGRNGRPDLVLYNSKGVIVGVVEVKRAASIVEDGNYTVAQKQAAHYKHLFQAVEVLLVYVVNNRNKVSINVNRIGDSILEFAETSLDTMLTNINSLNKAIIHNSS